jgi:hypothetical protein
LSSFPNNIDYAATTIATTREIQTPQAGEENQAWCRHCVIRNSTFGSPIFCCWLPSPLLRIIQQMIVEDVGEEGAARMADEEAVVDEDGVELPSLKERYFLRLVPNNKRGLPRNVYRQRRGYAK